MWKKNVFDTMSHLWPMTSFVDVILLYFTNFTTLSPFWATSRDFYEIFISSKVLHIDQRNILGEYVFNTMYIFWPLTSFVTSFCSISLILPLHRPFEQLSLIFTKYLFRVKLFNMTRRSFWENIVLLPCLFFDPMTSLVTSFCSISLLLLLHRPFEQINLILTKYLIRVKLFNMTRGTFWENIF